MTRAFRVISLAALLGLSLAAPAAAAPARQEAAVVHAVLFYSPTCGHCHYVITKVLPPLFEQYGSQLQIVGIDVTNPAAQDLFDAANDLYQIPDEARGAVPLLVVGDRYLLGSRDIPAELPGIVEAGLAAGGIDWPPIPGLAEALALIPDTPTPSSPSPMAATSTASDPSSMPATPTAPAPPSIVGPPPAAGGGMIERFLQDPAGNGLSVVVLLGMLVSLAVGGIRLMRTPVEHPAPWKTWAVPILAAAGMLISAYLTYVQTSGALAVCGPVGDCNTVQTSQYAYLFGVVPMGLVGLAGYLAILLAWGAARRLSGRNADLAWVALLAFTAFGTVFSAILTFLEPFVIGATCSWCLASAVLMTALLWLAVGPGIAALGRLSGDEEEPGEGDEAEPATSLKG